MEKRKCPICRGGIIMVYRVQFVDKKSKEENDNKKLNEDKNNEDNNNK